MNDGRKLIELLSLAREYLEKKGIENPRANAEALLGKTLGLPRIELYLQYDRPLSEVETAQFRDLLKRRAQREPLQLITGTVDFFGATIEVAPKLLIPRPETEQLTSLISKHVLSLGDSSRIRLLDIGCGTGCIGVSLAQQHLHLVVDAVDVDFAAISCTIRNATNSDVADRVNAFHADVLGGDFPDRVSPPYNVVLSNPPYIVEAQIDALQPEVSMHEARGALNGGVDGLVFYRRIADHAPRLLSSPGLLAVEVGWEQSEAVGAIFRTRFDRVEFANDFAGHARFVLANS